MTLIALGLGALCAPARADAEPLCRSLGGVSDAARLGSIVSGFVLAPPAPGQPALPPPSWLPSSGVGAASLAREALAAQFSGHWLSGAVDGWVVGLAPGPLDAAAARTAIVERVGAHYTADETAYLSGRLHIDPQLFGDDDLRATQEAAQAKLFSEAAGTYWSASVGCRLSDARRVEIGVYQPATPEQFLRVVELLAPFGDKVRVELLTYGPPSPAIGLAPPTPPRPPTPQPARPPVALARHVRMPLGTRCIRAGRVRIAARPSTPRVTRLTVQVAGTRRSIGGARLKKPLTVVLRARRTRVVVTVRLADGRVGTRSVTYTRCG